MICRIQDFRHALEQGRSAQATESVTVLTASVTVKLPAHRVPI